MAGLVFKTSGTARERRPGGSIPLLYRSPGGSSAEPPRRFPRSAEVPSFLAPPGSPTSSIALLAAELVDNAGWDLLVALADEAGDHEARREFRKRMHEEADHLLLVRKAVQKFSMQEVLGEDVTMPGSTLGAILG